MLGAVAAPMAAASGQEPAQPPAAQLPAPPPTAAIFGTVYDSLRFRPMAGAFVRVDTTNLISQADAAGRFQIAGVPPGVHYLRVEHPLLDTLGVGLRSADIEFHAGEGTIHELATPTSPILIERFCPAAWRARGPAALMGRVREADTGAPATGAKVSLVWYEAASADAKPVLRVRESQVGPDGIYRICGLPAKLEGKVQVLRGALTSGDISVSFGEDLLALRSMTIATPGAVIIAAERPDSTAPAAGPVILGNARLTGRVTSRGGVPIPGARVILEGTARVTTTRSDGSFSLDSLPPGTQSVAVRKLGYTPADAAVDLASEATRAVTIAMDDFVPTLETVRVSAQRERALADVGFGRRQRAGSGYYLEGDQINRESLNFSDVLRNVPGLRITFGAGGRQQIESARGPFACVAIWIDGTQWQQMEPGDVDAYVRAQEVEAIEVYGPSNTPIEFQGRSGSCTTIIVWTARRINRPRR